MLKLEIYFECKFGICNSPPLPTYLPPLSQPLTQTKKLYFNFFEFKLTIINIKSNLKHLIFIKIQLYWKPLFYTDESTFK